jgi:hypothetical protein
MSDKQDKTAYWENLVSPNFIKHLVCGFLWSRNHFQRGIRPIKLGGFHLVLVCATGFNLCICHTDICLCSFDEQTRQKNTDTTKNNKTIKK